MPVLAYSSAEVPADSWQRPPDLSEATSEMTRLMQSHKEPQLPKGRSRREEMKNLKITK